MGKGACIKRMAAIRNYSTNTIVEKKQGRGRERVKDTEFSVNIIRTLLLLLFALPTSNT